MICWKCGGPLTLCACPAPMPDDSTEPIDLTQTLLYRCEHGTAPFPCTCGRSAPATDAPAERERVYIVTSGGGMCDDHRLHAVFSTRSLADAYVESASEERDGWGWNDLKIEEWDVDTSVPVEP